MGNFSITEAFKNNKFFSAVPNNIIIGVAIAIVAVLVIVIIVSVVKAKKRKKLNKVSETKIANGQKVTKNKDVLKGGDANVTLSKKDIILEKGVTLIVNKRNDFYPGKYTILSAKGKDEKFNIRVGDLVREYTHGEDIIVAENQKITAVSHNVILR